MKKLVSVSTEPVKEKNQLINYAKSMFSVADYLHCDVMDKEFIGRDVLSVEDVKNINDNSGILLDVHLMTKDLNEKFFDYIDAGANILTIHYESFSDKNKLINTLKKIRKKYALSGLSFVPDTSVDQVLPYLQYCDVVLVMSVVPGKSGQSFLEDSYQKIQRLALAREKFGYNFLISVDGGINPKIAKKLYDIGADMVVSGSYVYNSPDPQKAVQEFKNI